jgi:hypothetical protein
MIMLLFPATHFYPEVVTTIQPLRHAAPHMQAGTPYYVDA